MEKRIKSFSLFEFQGVFPNELYYVSYLASQKRKGRNVSRIQVGVVQTDAKST